MDKRPDRAEGRFVPLMTGPRRPHLVLDFPPPTALDESIASLLSNTEAMQHLLFMAKPDSGGWTAADARERRERQAAEFDKGTSLNATVKYNGEFAGIGGFRDISWWNSSCEMGIILDPKFWGKQISTEVHLMCLSYAFETLRLNRVEFRTAASNSVMVFFLKELLGATHEGTIRDYFPVGINAYADVELFSVLAADWPRSKEKLEDRLSQKLNNA